MNVQFKAVITSTLILIWFSAAALVAVAQSEEQSPIDPARGRQLMQKAASGETLTAEEQAYLERVKQAIRERASQNRSASTSEGIDMERVRTLTQRVQANEKLSDDDQAYLERARQTMRQRAGLTGGPNATARPNEPVDPSVWQGLIAIIDMTIPYQGEDGGLYGNGKNDPPEAHRAAHLKLSQEIRPLDASGVPSSDGKIGLITIGFSNTSIESEHFKRTADADPEKSPNVIIVNGSQGGRSAVMWAWDGADVLSAAEQERLDQQMDLLGMPKSNRRTTVGTPKDTWPTLANRIAAAGLTAEQVQVCWLKHVEANPKPLGEFPAHARALQADISSILNIAKLRYPNLRVVYLSSRTFGGWSGRSSGSPEPYAYESGFGTRWVVQSQIQGDEQLNYDSARGEVKSPLVLWGPYLWAQGDTPRKVDGMTWTQNDVRDDQLHPNEAGSQKTTRLLMDFFKTNEGTRMWFLNSHGK